MASSIKLEFPLGDGLPNTEHARDRLLAKIWRYRKDKKKSRDTSDEDYALLYAYGTSLEGIFSMSTLILSLALVTGQLSNEIHSVIQELEKLFGTLDEDMLKLN